MFILTVDTLCSEAALFSAVESRHPKPLLYGVTDGKAVGTYLEQKFKLYLKNQYEFVEGNSASGIDFPELLIDVKVTSIKQPQASSNHNHHALSSRRDKKFLDLDICLSSLFMKRQTTAQIELQL